MDAVRQFNLGYFLKNIPILTAKEYMKLLVSRTEDVVKRMRWKAFFFLNGTSSEDDKERYGFRSRKCPPQVDELKAFEDDLCNMIDNVVFRPVPCEFQDKMKKDLKRVKECSSVVVAADKSRNLYRMPSGKYKSVLRDNITKTYRKAPGNLYGEINREAKKISKDLDLDDRMDTLAKAQAFVTLKDHKDNFVSKLPCRLINPAKSELGKVSKKILENITGALREGICPNLWKNTSAVVEWFKSIDKKAEHTFIVFDIVDFYPSITEDLLRQALSFARAHVQIQENEIDIIMHARKSLLFDDGQEWVKKDGTFDVTMGSFDGAEVCEIVGAFLLTKLTPLLGESKIGLYRDDGLGVVENRPGPALDRCRKDIIHTFKMLGLRVTIEVNLKEVNYLDLAMSLNSGTYRPYMKPNSVLMYVNAASNHPPQVLKNVPAGINKRLASISCSKEVFDDAKGAYQDALKASGYDHKLEFVSQTSNSTHGNRKQRHRNVLWYNPPYSKAVKTSIGGTFLRLIRKHFPHGSRLHQIFNKNNVKVSYSCTSNMAARIRRHNNTILQPPAPAEPCNCRVKESCPLNGKCKTADIVYEASVQSSTGVAKKYIGSTATAFKTRYANHQTSMRHERHANATELSKYVWSLKRSEMEYSIKWEIKERARSYNNASKRCNLCTAEKLHILTADKSNTLNRRNELVSKCRHDRKYSLAHAIT